MAVVLLLSILTTIAFFAAMPFLCVFFEVLGTWYESVFDRLELAAERFCEKHGWY